MGSAFPGEPFTDRAQRDGAVLFALSAPDAVVHLKHPDCPIEAPHAMTHCGMFEWSFDSLLQQTVTKHPFSPVGIAAAVDEAAYLAVCFELGLRPS